MFHVPLACVRHIGHVICQRSRFPMIRSHPHCAPYAPVRRVASALALLRARWQPAVHFHERYTSSHYFDRCFQLAHFESGSYMRLWGEAFAPRTLLLHGSCAWVGGLLPRLVLSAFALFGTSESSYPVHPDFSCSIRARIAMYDLWPTDVWWAAEVLHLSIKFIQKYSHHRPETCRGYFPVDLPAKDCT